MKRLLVTLLLALFSAPALYAGVTGSFSIVPEYSDNLDRTSTGDSGSLIKADARLDYNWKRDRWSGALCLEGAGFIFPGSPERNYSLQNARAGIGWRPSEKSQLRAGFGIGERSGHDAYSIYDFREIDAFLEGRRKLGSRGLFLGGYTFRKRGYESLEPFDYAEHRLYSRLDLPAGERVTIGIYNELGYKFYSEDFQAIDSRAETEKDAPAAGQWSGSIRLSAPLGESTGLRLQLLRHVNFGDRVAETGAKVNNYLAGEELYDDRYTYESLECGVQVSQRISKGVIVRAGYGLAFKDYQQRAMDLERQPVPEAGLRNDRQERFTLRIEKRWKKQQNPCVTKLYAEGAYLRNRSNDLLYDYTALTAGAGIAVEF